MFQTTKQICLRAAHQAAQLKKPPEQRTTRDPIFDEFPEPSSNLLYNSITYIYIVAYIYILYTYN